MKSRLMLWAAAGALVVLDRGSAVQPPKAAVFQGRSVINAGTIKIFENNGGLDPPDPRGMGRGLDSDPALLILEPAILDSPDFLSANGGNAAGRYSFAQLVTSQSPNRNRKSPLAAWLNFMRRRLTPQQGDALERLWSARGRSEAAFPLRALAVVNRIDLFKPEANSCGELRFVYGAFGSGARGVEVALDFFVIAEFPIACRDWTELKGWANGWLSLRTPGALPGQLGPFLDATLQRKSGWRVRTNQLANTGGWEFREFSGPEMAPANLALTPAASTLCSRDLAAQVLKLGSAGDPDSVFDQAVYQPQTQVLQYQLTNVWLKPLFGHGTDARYHFAIRTCVGCHSLETRNPLGAERFTHIRNRLAGTKSLLSGFLTGGEYTLSPPPSGCAIPAGAREPARVFADLLRRQQVLVSLAAARSAADIAGIPRLWDVH
ncbi:MAG: hypothetical protein QM757_17225 [Paludibaculum sp.]